MPYMDDIHGMHVEDVEVFLPKDSATLLCFFFIWFPLDSINHNLVRG